MPTLILPLATLAERMSATASRLAKRAAIAEAIAAIANGPSAETERAEENDRPPGDADRSAALTDAGLFCQYLAGLSFAEADPRKLSAGGALLSKAVLAVSGATAPALTAAYRRHGDLGAAAADLLLAADAQKTATVTLGEVAASFDAMATARTTAARAATVEALLARATALEAKYLLKLMLGDMRIGVKQSLVEEAIAVAAAAEVGQVRHAVMLEADLAGAVRRAFAGTLPGARMRLFHPLGFMLASPVETPEEAIERFAPKPVKPAPEKKPRKTAGRKRAPAAGGEALGQGIDRAEAFADTSELDTIAPAAAGPAAAEAAELPTEAAELATEAADLAAGTAEQAGTAPPPPGPIQAFLEDKYDGMRAQIHCADPEQPGRVAIYSRNREDITESFPDLVEAFSRAHPASGDAVQSGLILDGEILGWDLAQGRALPFAVLGPRIGRKRISDEVRRTVPVVFMTFDLMYAHGALQLDRPLRDRRNRLEALSEQLVQQVHSPLAAPPSSPKPPTGRRSRAVSTAQAPLHFGEQDAASASALSGVIYPADELSLEQVLGSDTASPDPLVPRLLLSPARLVESADDIARAYVDARARANEGVMLKAADSVYQPGRRGLAWVKLKRELATLDVVITGAEFGTGRRAPFLSDYTFAVRGAEGELLNVGKAYSGVTDQEIVELTDWLKAHTLEDFGHFRTVEPEIVLEVAFNNIMRSDRHASGFALRFPRILRIRTDKPLAEIDTVERVEEVYQSQVDKPAGAVPATENDQG